MTIKIDESVERFIYSLDKQTIAKVLRIIDLLDQFGPQLGAPHSKKVEERIFELRIRGKREIRIFYAFHTSKIILLHGFVKKSSKIPLREIKRARNKIKGLDLI